MADPSDTDPTDEEIEATLSGVAPRRWRALWKAFDQLLEETRPAEWAGGQQIDTTVVGGVDHPVIRMPYIVYAESVEKVVQALYAMEAVVPFNWPEWRDLDRFRDPQALPDASVADAVRLITAIIRSDRFSEGSLAAAIEQGLLQAAIQRLRTWRNSQSVASKDARKRERTKKRSDLLEARREGCAVACAAIVEASAPVDVKREALASLIRYATPKGVMRPGDLCSGGVAALDPLVGPVDDSIHHEHVVPVRVLVDRMLAGDTPEMVLEASLVAHVLASEHRRIGPLVRDHADLYEEMKKASLADLPALGRRRYEARELELVAIPLPTIEKQDLRPPDIASVHD